MGLTPRLNRCVGLARGQYIARMDADDVAYPQRLDRQVRFLQEHPDIDLLGAGAVVFEGTGEVFGRYPTACTHEDICRRPWWGFPLAHPTWMGKRRWFQSHPYCEGHARVKTKIFLLRELSDEPICCLEEVLLGYRVEGISVSNSMKGRYNFCRTLVSAVHDAASAAIAARGVAIHALGIGRDVFMGAVGGKPGCFHIVEPRWTRRISTSGEQSGAILTERRFLIDGHE